MCGEINAKNNYSLSSKFHIDVMLDGAYIIWAAQLYEKNPKKTNRKVFKSNDTPPSTVS
jgi:hypothetical protein